MTRARAAFWSLIALLGLIALNLGPAPSQTVTTPPAAALACAYTASPPAPVSGQFFYVQCDSTGHLITSSTGGTTTPGGTPGQIQYNNSGAFGGFTMSGDCTTNTATGAITCTTINGNTPATGPALPSTANDTQLYPLWSGVLPATGTVALSQNTARCAPFFVSQPMHWDELVISVTTAGTGPIVVALYSDAIDATSKKHQPQTIYSSSSLSFTVSSSPTQPTVALGVAGTGIAIPVGLNWICWNNTNAADAVRVNQLSLTTTIISSLIGATGNPLSVLSNAQVTNLSTAQSAASWPSFVGVTFTENAAAASTIMFAYRVASAP